jgi:hypothetical protein
MYFSEDCRYEGEWKNDKMEGRGVFNNNSTGEKYNGYFRNSVKEGIGIFTWSNGDSYSGKWKNDKKDGRGEKRNINNKTIKIGNWINDEFEEQ